MILGRAAFLTSSTSFDNLPKSTLPEVAFIGRSNVGKSTLINALTKNVNLAKTSKIPGRTQQINFFQTAAVMLVDLPGYGYTQAPPKESRKWVEFNLEYIEHRQQLRIVFVLVDARIGLKELDVDLIKQMYEWGCLCQIIYTKSDKLNKSELEMLKQVMKFNSRYDNLVEEALITSSKNKNGIVYLEKAILAVALKKSV